MLKTAINPSLSIISVMHLSYIRSDRPLEVRSRVLLAIWALFLISIFAVACRLEPDPRGFGTHQRLGLPPCTIRILYHIPCPSCGMTTSFSHFVRGEFREAARANAGGLLLAIVCALQVPWCLLSAIHAKTWKVSRPDLALLWILAILCIAAILQWTIRLLQLYFPS